MFTTLCLLLAQIIMAIRRGDVVTVAIEQGPGMPVKRRPAVVVQSDYYNQRLITAVVAQITSNTRHASSDSAQVFVDYTTTAGKQTGLVKDSAVKCFNLYLKLQRDMRKIGSMPAPLMQEVDAALKIAQGLS